SSNSRSRSSCTAGWASPVTITILPSLVSSTRMISTPAERTAFTALVTSACRNVDGARAMATAQLPAYAPSLHFTNPSSAALAYVPTFWVPPFDPAIYRPSLKHSVFVIKVALSAGSPRRWAIVHAVLRNGPEIVVRLVRPVRPSASVIFQWVGADG